MDEVPRISSLKRITLSSQPCCIDFCPEEPRLFVVGTYELTDAATQQKRGGLQLVYIDETTNNLCVLCTESLDVAIYDVHFSPTMPHFLAACTSSGNLLFYRVSTARRNFSLEPCGMKQVFAPENSILSFNWCPDCVYDLKLCIVEGSRSSATPEDYYFARSPVLCVSADNGEVRVIKLRSLSQSAKAREEGDVECLLATHNDQAWITMHMKLVKDSIEEGRLEDKQGCILSGADDGTLSSDYYEAISIEGQELHRTDGLQLYRSLNEYPSNFHDSRIHDFGVTAVWQLNGVNNSFLSGSFDNHIRLLTLPNGLEDLPPPKVLTSLDLHGTVWKIRLLAYEELQPATNNSEADWTFLVTLVQDGAAVVKLTRRGPIEWDLRRSRWDMELLARFEEHDKDALCYACEPGPFVDKNDARKGTDRPRFAVSCAFYGKELCLWQWPGPQKTPAGKDVEMSSA